MIIKETTSCLLTILLGFKYEKKRKAVHQIQNLGYILERVPVWLLSCQDKKGLHLMGDSRCWSCNQRLLSFVQEKKKAHCVTLRPVCDFTAATGNSPRSCTRALTFPLRPDKLYDIFKTALAGICFCLPFSLVISCHVTLSFSGLKPV